MRKNANFFIGVIILLLGFFFLARNLGWIPHYWHFGQFWPLILIAVGIWFLFGKQHN